MWYIIIYVNEGNKYVHRKRNYDFEKALEISETDEKFLMYVLNGTDFNTFQELKKKLSSK